MFEQKILDSIDVIAHSGIRIGGERIVYIDPVCVADAPHDADLILFTHPHFDHFSPVDVRKLMKDDTVIAAPKSMIPLCSLMLRRKTISLLPNETTSLAGVSVTAVPAYNRRKPYHVKWMQWLGYVLTVGETKIYISGDTDLTDEARNVSCDIAMLPIGGFYTIDAVRAAELANTIRPHTVIPIHYGMLMGGKDAPRRFCDALDSDIAAELRPAVYSSVLVSMYAKAALLIAAACLFGLLAGRFL